MFGPSGSIKVPPGLPPCPDMARAGCYPVFLHLMASGVVPTPLNIGVARRRGCGDDVRWVRKAGIIVFVRRQVIGLHPLLNDQITIDGSDDGIVGSLEDHGWDHAGVASYHLIGPLPCPEGVHTG